MKPSLFPILLLACSSCATYQYATVSSPIKDELSQTFLAENDTVKITYAFNGDQGPVKISIYNKLQTPLYIDWSKSALIVNNERKSYSNNNSVLKAEMDGTQSRWMNSTTQSGSITGTITSHEISGFIPPQSWATESQVAIDPEPFSLPASSGQSKKKVFGITVNSFSYTPEQSPLTFRSFITLSAHADFSSAFYFDHEFWVSEIFQTSTGPRNFPVQPDRFHTKKVYAGGEALVVAGAVGIAGIMLISMQESKKALLD